MATLTLRSVKGSPLTHNEVDGNFTNLNTDKVELTDLSVATNAAGSAALTYSDVTGVFTYTPPDLSSYLTAESDTLDSVTGRGSSTTNSLTVGGLHVNSTDAVEMPVGTDAERPTPVTGMLRFNTDSTSFEGYDGSAWGAIGGGSENSFIVYEYKQWLYYVKK